MNAKRGLNFVFVHLFLLSTAETQRYDKTLLYLNCPTLPFIKIGFDVLSNKSFNGTDSLLFEQRTTITGLNWIFIYIELGRVLWLNELLMIFLVI